MPSIRRDYHLKVIEERLPGMYRFVHQMYGACTAISFQGMAMINELGVQQGDPLGPALFCLSIAELTKSLQSRFNVWYLDDGSLVSDVNAIISDIQTINSYSGKIGLKLNSKKCEFFLQGGTFEDQDDARRKLLEVLPGAVEVTEEGLEILGAPLSRSGIKKSVETKGRVVEKFCQDLNTLNNAHSEYYLLKSSLGVPRVIHLMRSSPVHEFPHLLRRFDQLSQDTLERILNVKLQDNSFLTASLPVRYGGLGIRRVSDHALACYLSSIYAVSKVVELILPTESVCQFNNTKTQIYERFQETHGPLPANELSSQHKIDQALIEKLVSEFPPSESAFVEARKKAISHKMSGRWLEAIPSLELGTMLDNNTFRIASALRLGLPFTQPYRCSRCATTVASTGEHGLHCLKLPPTQRHDNINGVISRAMRSIHMPHRLEPERIKPRPDGITLLGWSHGKQMIWDVTVVSSVCATNVVAAATESGGAAKIAELKKMKKYDALKGEYIIQPVALESYGCPGPSTEGFLREIGQRLREESQDPRAGLFFDQRLSLELQRGNVKLILSTMERG